MDGFFVIIFLILIFFFPKFFLIAALIFLALFCLSVIWDWISSVIDNSILARYKDKMDEFT